MRRWIGRFCLRHPWAMEVRHFLTYGRKERGW